MVDGWNPLLEDRFIISSWGSESMVRMLEWIQRLIDASRRGREANQLQLL